MKKDLAIIVALDAGPRTPLYVQRGIKMYDVVIIGAGVIGSFIARELAKYDLNILLLEKGPDVASGSSKANTAIVHSGYSPKPGTLKAKLNKIANPLFEKICEELDVPFKRIGSLLVAFDEEGVEKVKKKYKRGIKNNINSLEIIDRKRLLEMEPNLNKDAICALYAPTTGIVGPWEFTIALAENAVDNGVTLKLNTKVEDIHKSKIGYQITTNQGIVEAKYVINCAGLFADEINNMVAPCTFKIVPKRGNYYVLDKKVGNIVNHVIFQGHKKELKNIIVTPTVHGNLLIGPGAVEIEDKTDLKTTRKELELVRKSSKITIEDIPFEETITTFAALRPKSEILVKDEEGKMVFSEGEQDFIIGIPKEAPGFINVAGIKSPGLTASPAISKYVVEIFKKISGELKINPAFNPRRRRVIRFSELTDREKAEVIKKDARYGNIVCRCEQITEGEIVDSIHRNVGATTLDGVKRRVRAGMGRCQGGFCAAKVMDILARELKKDIVDIKKDSPNSYILTQDDKEGYHAKL